MRALRIPLPRLRAESGGLFVSRGEGSHPRRVLASHELIFVRSGLLRLREAGRVWEVRAGEMLRLEPGLIHEGAGVYPADLRFYWVHFRLGFTSAKAMTAAVPKHGPVQRPERMAELFHRFLDDQESGRHDPAEAAVTLLALLLEARRRGRPGGSPGISSLAGKARTHLAAHFAEPVSTRGLAERLRVNSDYLGRIFRAAYGVSIVEALHRERLREARALLRESSLNIEEIGLAVGFRDASHFRRLFRRAQGISPRNYRRLYARLHINRR